MRAFIQSLARDSGLRLLRAFRKTVPHYNSVRGGDLHTIYDFRSERHIASQIQKKYPDHSILAEESGLRKGNSSYAWIIDPLDGTSNFVHHNPFFAVSIAVTDKKGLLLGAIFAPALGELFFAERGKGAFLNGRRIRVSSIRTLPRSYVVCCDGHEPSRRRFARMHNLLIPKTMEFRKIASAAIECSMVASGRADGYLTLKIAPWDVAAGILLVQEAGGKVTDFQGRSWNRKMSDLVASNGKIHNQLLRLVKKL